MATQYASLEALTTIVADTGDVDAIRQHKPTDATTNPSLLLKAAQMDQYQHLVDDAVAYGRKQASNEDEIVSFVMDKLAVNFGAEILKIVPGVVSTELDARLSFDTKACVAKAHEIIALYSAAGIAKERILIKIASTWEGIEAARVLEAEGIHCNMTLLFSIQQAVACAEAGATLISPFVGRITDWHKKDRGVSGFDNIDEDPGVQSVREIFNYYNKFGYKTVVMGASFRSKAQIVALAGCDKLTIGPKFLVELRESKDAAPALLQADKAQQMDIPKIEVSEAQWRFAMNDDACATEKLAEGIRKFAIDTVKLESVIRAKLNKRAKTQ